MLFDDITIEEYILRVAIPNNKYHFHKDLAGRLTGYIPQPGQLIVLNNFNEVGTVIKSPNSTKDFLIELPSGARLRKSLYNNDIEGYIDV